MLKQDADAIRQKAEEADKTPVYIALFGQPGAGKSSLINAIVGQPLAKVGVENDVTTKRSDYQWNGLFLSDLPGYGTTKFPSDVYKSKFELDKFDIFLCVTAGKLKDDDVRLFKELVDGGKRCIFVRNKIETEFEIGVTDNEIRSRIRANICEQIGPDAKVLFTSCRTMQGLSELMSTISQSLVGVKRDRFLRSAAAYSKEFLDEKKKVCHEYVWYAAALSAVANAVPLPVVGVTADIAIIMNTMGKIRNDFNLTEARMDKFVNLAPSVGPMIKDVIKQATGEGIKLILKRIATSATVSEVAKYIPAVGSVISGTVSLVIIRQVLTMYIEDCYKIAHEMLDAHFQS